MDKKYLLKHVILEEDDRITNISEFQHGNEYIMKGTRGAFPGVRRVVTIDQISGSSTAIIITTTDCVFDGSHRLGANVLPYVCILTSNKPHPILFSSYVFYDFAKISERYNAFVKIYNDIIQGILDVQPRSVNVRRTATDFRKRNFSDIKSIRKNPSSQSMKTREPLPPILSIIGNTPSNGGKKYRHHFVKTKKRKMNIGKTRAKRQNRLHR